MEILCENCRWLAYDEESEEEFCNLQLDEDEYIRLIQESSSNGCKYFCPDGGDYEITRRQN